MRRGLSGESNDSERPVVVKPVPTPRPRKPRETPKVVQTIADENMNISTYLDERDQGYNSTLTVNLMSSEYPTTEEEAANNQCQDTRLVPFSCRSFSTQIMYLMLSF